MAEERGGERQLVRLLGDHHAERGKDGIGQLDGLPLEPRSGARQLVRGLEAVDFAELVQRLLDLPDGRLAVPACLLLRRGGVGGRAKVAPAVGVRARAAAAAAARTSAVRGVVHRRRGVRLLSQHVVRFDQHVIQHGGEAACVPAVQLCADRARVPHQGVPQLPGDPGCTSRRSPQMQGSQERVADFTTSNFDGLICMLQPEQSWVAKWQRIGT